MMPKALTAHLEDLFTGNHADVMLIGYYTALLKLFDGANGEADPTKCSTAEEIVDWIGFAVVFIIYALRHFWLDRKDKIISKRPIWVRAIRLVMFTTLILCLHSQPISCSLPSSDALHTLSYVQGSIMLTMAVVATELCRSSIWGGSDDDQQQNA